MKIGLLAADSHNFPNLPLMKISAYYKAAGNRVEWWRADEEYDIVFCSVIFSETEIPKITNAKEVHFGGSGISLEKSLPDAIEHTTPDYSIYPQYDFAVGFLTRGCPRLNHTFCITPKKDGCVSRKVADLSEFWTGQKKISLLDQNLLACKDRIDLLNQLAASGAEIDFKGGLDARFVNEEVTYIVQIGKYYKVQVGAFSVKKNAEAMLEKLKKAGHDDAFITYSGTSGGTSARKITTGSKVRVKAGAKTYSGGSLASFVYSRDHIVKELSGKRAVITYGGTVVAAVNVDDLTLV